VPFARPSVYVYKTNLKIDLGSQTPRLHCTIQRRSKIDIRTRTIQRGYRANPFASE